MAEIAQIDEVFLALTVYREARGQAAEAKLAVAYSVMTRVRHPGWWGHDVISVVGKRWQYTSMTGASDPNLIIWPLTGSDAAWLECLSAAEQALAGSAPNPAPEADSYFDESIRPPAWARNAVFIQQIGKLRFYRVRADDTGKD